MKTNQARRLAVPARAPGLRPDGAVLPGEFLLNDGTPALIWPLLPTDGKALREGFRRLSPQSRRSRFLTALGELDNSMLKRLIDNVDGVHHIALVLVALPPDGQEGPVGVARLVQDPADPAAADIAVTVADDWQGRGVGTALVSALLNRRPAVVKRLGTIVQASNHESLALLAGAGHISAGPAHLGVLDVTVELAAADAIIVAPATYNTINKWAHGISDTYALGVLAETTGLGVPIIVLPFVNSALASRPPFQRSVEALRGEGVQILLGPSGVQPHPPRTGGELIDTYPWHLALDEAERMLRPSRTDDPDDAPDQ